MTITTALLIALLAAATALCGVGVWALTELVKTARSTRTLADDIDARAVPILEKADVTVDALNAELLRIDEIVTRMEEVSDRVASTSRTVQEVANAPAEIVNDLADRVRRAWKTRRQQPAPDEGVESDAEQDVSDTEPGEEPQPGAAEAVEPGIPDSGVYPQTTTGPGPDEDQTPDDGSLYVSLDGGATDASHDG